MERPEACMKEGFLHLQQTREWLEKAKIEYDKRSNFTKADSENSANVKSALHYLAAAYDEVSAIWENDINV